MECLTMGQVSLVEALLPAAYGSNQRLGRIKAQVDWQPIEALLQPMRSAPTGRPAYPPLVQLKALLLQHLRGLLTAPALQPALPFFLDGKGTACPIATRKKPWRPAELPAVLRAWPGGCGAGRDDLVASASTWPRRVWPKRCSRP